MSEKARDKALVDEIISVLEGRKGFGWWWEDIGSSNRADIKRKLRVVARRHLGPSPAVLPETALPV